MFPKQFEDSVAEMLGAPEGRLLLDALDAEPVVSVRFNPFKNREKPQGDPVPWNRYGFYLPQRPAFTLDPLLHAGAYYVQEASSMFVEHLYRQCVGEGRERVRLLDLCAAPGGKATLYSTLVGADGLVVANETVRQRAAVLADNVRRWGIGNVAVSCNDASHFAPYKHWFDVLAVDAPCSGEGMFRKNRDARAEWSPAGVELCAARQRRILADSWDALRPGGLLIYSTCTFNRAENEENIEWMARNYAVEAAPEVELPAAWGVEKGCAAGIETFRLWPHKARGEGFFAAVMRKEDGKINRKTPRARKQPLTEMNRHESAPLAPWTGQPELMKFGRAGESCYGYYRPQYQTVAALSEGLNIIYSGVCAGQIFNGKLRPDHALALFHDVVPAGAAEVGLALEQALDYLRKNDPRDLSPFAEGMNLLRYEGLPIGWLKRIGHRANTLLPNSFRIATL